MTGDIRLPPGFKLSSNRNVANWPMAKWKDGKIAYIISQGFKKKEIMFIKMAMQRLMDVSCLR